MTGWYLIQILYDKLSNSKPTGIIIVEESTYRLKRAVVSRNRKNEGFEIHYEKIGYWDIGTC